MTVVGITGPSGSGKSIAAEFLAVHGFKIIDADKIYADILIPPSVCLDELVSYFGTGILSFDGTLDRKALAAAVFGDENRERLFLLNKITHKYVVKRIRNDIQRYLEQNERGCVIDAPLLIEADLCRDCDFTVAVIADRHTRIDRIVIRDGISENAASQRVDSQKDDSFYITNTDHTVRNDGDVSAVQTEIERIFYERGVILNDE